MICTTLNKIRKHDPCLEGWKKLLQHLGKTEADDEPLPFSVIVDSNGLTDALWACNTVPKHDREWRLFAVWCARQVEHLMADKRSIDALDVAERYANGQATYEELRAARAAAGDAAEIALTASLDAAEVALAAALAAARASAWASARAAEWAVWAAARASADALAAARPSSWLAARDAARAAQTQKFLEVVL